MLNKKFLANFVFFMLSSLCYLWFSIIFFLLLLLMFVPLWMVLHVLHDVSLAVVFHIARSNVVPFVVCLVCFKWIACACVCVPVCIHYHFFGCAAAGSLSFWFPFIAIVMLLYATTLCMCCISVLLWQTSLVRSFCCEKCV